MHFLDSLHMKCVCAPPLVEVQLYGTLNRLGSGHARLRFEHINAND